MLHYNVFLALSSGSPVFSTYASVWHWKAGNRAFPSKCSKQILTTLYMHAKAYSLLLDWHHLDQEEGHWSPQVVLSPVGAAPVPLSLPESYWSWLHSVVHLSGQKEPPLSSHCISRDDNNSDINFINFLWQCTLTRFVQRSYYICIINVHGVSLHSRQSVGCFFYTIGWFLIASIY